jgi:hypothetical protein
MGSSLVPRSSTTLTREQHVDRIHNRVFFTGGSALVLVVSIILKSVGILGILGLGTLLPFLAILGVIGGGVATVKAIEAGKNPYNK